MAFMLGGFTQGLFAGMSAGTKFASELEGIKQQKMETQRQGLMLEGAKEAGAAQKADQDQTKFQKNMASAQSQGASLPSQALADAGNITPATNASTSTPESTSTDPVAPTDLDQTRQPKHLLPKLALAASPTGGAPGQPNPNSVAGPALAASPTGGAPGQPNPNSVAGPALAGPAAPAGVSARASAAPGGPLIWSADQGLHHAAPGESGITWGSGTGLTRTAPYNPSAAPATAPATALPTARPTAPHYLPENPNTMAGVNNSPTRTFRPTIGSPTVGSPTAGMSPQALPVGAPQQPPTSGPQQPPPQQQQSTGMPSLAAAPTANTGSMANNEEGLGTSILNAVQSTGF